LVVSNTGESSVCIIDAHEHKTVACLNVGGGPAHLAFSPDNELAFVACERADEIAVIELRRLTLLQTVQAGGQPN
jgi:DNA-binding beta-propeller fold protein YncE